MGRGCTLHDPETGEVSIHAARHHQNRYVETRIESSQMLCSDAGDLVITLNTILTSHLKPIFYKEKKKQVRGLEKG